MIKNLIRLTILLVLLLGSKACEKDEVTTDPQITAADIEAIKSAVMTGDWIITLYSDDTEDDTVDYAGYIFNFQDGGILATTNGNTSLSGAWSINSSDNGNDDGSSSDIDFNILFSSPEIFAELSDDWDVKKYSDSKIELMDISGGDGGTHLLTFEKL